MRFQPIYDIAELCSRKGLQEVVLCPGSRCAPLTLAFARHPKMMARTFSDERSAGYIALGMAQQSDLPVVAVCTSGTAAYNFAPAVAEACFSEIPLIIFTADRPAEWIAQHDGQTVYQSEIFGKHVKKYFQLPQSYDHPDDHWAINRIVNDAINLSQQAPKGPVHINAPFREPLYPEPGEQITYSTDVRVIEQLASSFVLTENQKNRIANALPGFQNILIVAGQLSPAHSLILPLQLLTAQRHIPIIADIISNLHEVSPAIKHADLFLGQASDTVKSKLRPDLLITFGQSTISKNAKLFLRKFPPQRHWHVQPHGTPADTFKNITEIFNASPEAFLEFLNTLPLHSKKSQAEYNTNWQQAEGKATTVLRELLHSTETHELGAVNDLLENLPAGCNLHLANSMSVRYANFIGLKAMQKGIRVFANRGTSGIDGCSSTAVGNLIASGRPTFLITGDVAFFYDRNAFWHNYPLGGLRILLLNNHGGLIFNIIDGPASMPEAEEYFITRQALNAKKPCEEFNIEYFNTRDKSKHTSILNQFLRFDGKPKLVEIETSGDLNKQVFNTLKLKIKQSYEL